MDQLWIYSGILSRVPQLVEVSEQSQQKIKNNANKVRFDIILLKLKMRSEIFDPLPFCQNIILTKTLLEPTSTLVHFQNGRKLHFNSVRRFFSLKTWGNVSWWYFWQFWKWIKMPFSNGFAYFETESFEVDQMFPSSLNLTPKNWFGFFLPPNFHPKYFTPCNLGGKWNAWTPWIRSKRKYSKWSYFIRSRLSRSN